uniref:Fatty acid hydroxylase domain-containing protein n=1 Tax=Leptospira ellisii TaxID=2023197 RepID=A0A2N0B4X9_9LEPT|nr:hypothetical protein CH379_17780 [Leptospira ellisii]
MARGKVAFGSDRAPVLGLLTDRVSFLRTLSIRLLHSFLSIFQHANLKTPRWLGFLVHRPENHALHHARGVHSFNYGNTPLFDFIFGTFRNPDSFPQEVGFYEGASLKILDMHLAKDVSKSGK